MPPEATEKQVPIIIQARMTSSRVPGKVLRKIGGEPLLALLLQRLEKSQTGFAVVATSVETSDDPIADFCRSSGVDVVRGPLDDVAMRFCRAIDKLQSDCFVRVCADSPFLDPALIDQAVGIYQQTDADLVTNVETRTFPVGQSVEVISSATYLAAYQSFHTADHFEHVTAYFYEHPDNFKIQSFQSDGHYNDCHMAIDTETNLQTLDNLVATLDRPLDSYGWKELMTRLDAAEA